jgi:PAS domain S-box-containing protein
MLPLALFPVLRYGGAIASAALPAWLGVPLVPALGNVFPFDLGLLVLAGAVATFLAAWAVGVAPGRHADEVRSWLGAIVDSAQDAVVGSDLEGTIVSWNRGAEWLFGYTAAEAAGLPTAFVLPPDRPDELADVLRRLRKGEGVEPYDTVWLQKHGSRVAVSVAVSPVRDDAGSVIGASAIARKLPAGQNAQSEVARLNRELERRVTELQTLLEVSPVGIAVAEDPQCRRIVVNAALRAMLGVPAGANASLSAPPGELPGFRACREGRDVLPEELPMQQSVSQGVAVRDARVDILRADGRVVRLLHNVAPLFDEDGKVRGCVAVCIDVTEEQRLMHELRQRNAELAEADRRKDEFLSMLGHELRNPLAPLRMAADILATPGLPPEVLGQHCKLLHRQVQQLTGLVDDLLDVSRIARGRITLRKQPVELATVVERAVEAQRPFLDTQGHELSVALPDEPVWLEADPVRLSQVIGNLLHNAGKFSEKGGHIGLTAEVQGPEVVMRVRDGGVGIDPELLPRVFEAFVQGDRSLGRSRGGLGVGLTLVKSLVELHGGRVEARSDGLGRGTEFAVRLPARTGGPEDGGEADAQRAGPPCDARPCRVLVIDDSVDTAESMTLLLRLWGHEVRVAHDGPAAVAVAGEYRPEVVLLDIGLPGMTGHEVAKQLREEPGLKSAMLIAVTGYGQEQDRRLSREAGIDHHLVKPIDLGALQQLLASR